MEQQRLNLYFVDMKYIRNLAKVDDQVMSVSPQIGKEERPFVGIIVICHDRQYCVPLSSPKPKHKNMKNTIDFTRIIHDGRLLGVLNFNEMIPVRTDVISLINVRHRPNESHAEAHYKELVSNQLAFCRRNQDALVHKANSLYESVTSGKASASVIRRCCDFRKLESVLDRYQKK